MLSADGALTGYENLVIFAKLYDIPRAERESRVRNALAFMGIGQVGADHAAVLCQQRDLSNLYDAGLVTDNFTHEPFDI